MQHPESDAYTSENAKFIADMLEQSGTKPVRIRTPIHDRVKKVCENNNVSINEYVNAAVAMRLFWEEQIKEENKK